ncbi:hypothetical protein BDV12DRAFT_204775 [Aspergillus spectabilis]
MTGDIKYDAARSSWFDPGVRFVVVVTPHDKQAFENDSWTCFIVGSEYFDSTDSFLQVASWNGHTFRFYSRGLLDQNAAQSAWVYQGSSWDAFDAEKSYLGPFNGHINGVVVMKELQNPWLHWQSASGSVHDSLSPEQKANFQSKEYLSTPNLALAKVKSADHLEVIVKHGISSWYGERIQHDFMGNGLLKDSPANIPRWVAHLLLTTTVNIHCGEINTATDSVNAPPNHFLQEEVLKAYQPATEIYANLGELRISRAHYNTACERLGIARLKEVNSFDNVPPNLQVTLDQGSLGSGRPGEILFAICARDKGRGLFTILTPSLEDSTGALYFQKLKRTSLISEKLFNCLLMIDYWNPVYSWRRGVLMQYMPRSATYNGILYDLEETFIKAVRQSSLASEPHEVEKQFLDLYANYSLPTMAQRVTNYVDKIKQRLETLDGVCDYMLLAESRRRIFRPLRLNEFGLTLPFALKYPTTETLPLKEMTEDGKVVNMPDRGKQFLTLWTGTLWTDDPNLIPEDEVYQLQERPPGNLDPVSPRALPQRERTRRTA